MHTGELTDSVRERSVYRPLHLKPDNLHGQGDQKMAVPAVSVAPPLPGYADQPWRQVTSAVNALAVMGADDEGGGLFLQGLLPERYEETALREDMKHFAAEAEQEGMKFYDAGLQISMQVKTAQYFVLAVAGESPNYICQSEQDHLQSEKIPAAAGLHPGQELLVTRQIALAGTAALARLYEEELRKRYPLLLVEKAKGFSRWMSVTEAARAVRHFGSCAMHCISQGGIFNALWEMAERTGVGLEVDLRKIPVNQETIEICEYFDINPYYLYSEGSLLIGTERAEELIAILRDMEIPACVIGRVTGSNDRILRNGENRRYLDRPKQDEFWRFSEGRERE